MAKVDIDSALPIRSQADGNDERVHIKIVDYADPGGVDKQVEVSEKLAHVRMFGQDSSGDKTQQRLSELGANLIDGLYDATNNLDPSNIGMVLQERNASASDIRQTMRPTAKRGTVDTDTVSIDVSLHDELGNAYTKNNPMPVSIEESEGDEICNYFESAAAIAKDASDNHDYTVSVGKTLVIDGIWASASGKMSIELLVETGVATNTFTSRLVGFNSTANPNISPEAFKRIKVAAGVRVRIIRTNLDNNPQTMYSTIFGDEK